MYMRAPTTARAASNSNSQSHEPVVRFAQFGDSNINFNVVLRIESRIYKFTVRHEFIKALKKAYDKNNIEISWPVMKIVKG